MKRGMDSPQEGEKEFTTSCEAGEKGEEKQGGAKEGGEFKRPSFLSFTPPHPHPPLRFIMYRKFAAGMLIGGRREFVAKTDSFCLGRKKKRKDKRDTSSLACMGGEEKEEEGGGELSSAEKREEVQNKKKRSFCCDGDDVSARVQTKFPMRLPVSSCVSPPLL